MEKVLRIGSLGEKDSADGATVTAVSVSVGDSVRSGDCLLEIETDKAAIEVPAEDDGTVQALTVKVGDLIAPGSEFGRLLVDVAKPTGEGGRQQSDDVVVDRRAVTGPETTAVGIIRANPSVRRLARERGIDIANLTGTGSRGRITKEDVIQFGTRANERTLAQSPIADSLPEFQAFGPTHREPLDKVARVMSEHMTNCWSRIPHAWLQETIDITDTEEWRRRHKDDFRRNGGSLTLTTILAKAVASVLREFPKLNSSYDESVDELVYKEYVDIGIAVDTDYGLVVPSCRGVDRKGLAELSRELAVLIERARHRKLSPQDLQGGSITISNLGGIGLSGTFPIVNWPQVAILGVSAGVMRPKWRDGRVVPRLELTTTIGFDHRVINGAEGARFLVRVKEYLEDMRLMLL